MITNQWLSENMMKWIETIMIIDLLELALRKKRQKRVKMDWIYTSAVLLLSWWLHSTGRRKLSKWCKRKIKLKTILMSIRKSIGYSLYLCDIGHFNLFCIIYRVLLHTLMHDSHDSINIMTIEILTIFLWIYSQSWVEIVKQSIRPVQRRECSNHNRYSCFCSKLTEL